MTSWTPGSLAQTEHFVFQQQALPLQGPRSVLVNGDYDSALSWDCQQNPSHFLQRAHHLCIHWSIHWCVCLFIQQTFTQKIEISVPADPNIQLFFLPRAEFDIVGLRSSFYFGQKLLPKGCPCLYLICTGEIEKVFYLQRRLSPSLPPMLLSQKDHEIRPEPAIRKPELKSSFPPRHFQRQANASRSARTLMLSSRIGTLIVF